MPAFFTVRAGLRFPPTMAGSLSDSDLDQILALQLMIAWAGEGLCRPPRLGWWQTDLVDEAGGGDLFARLTPRLQHWSALEAVRETARRHDARCRREVAEPERVRTLFNLGFRVEEQLATRLSILKGAEDSSRQPLPLVRDPETPFSREALTQSLAALTPRVKHTAVLGGRELSGAVLNEPLILARQLAIALIPLTDHYPMPFARASA